MCTLQAWQRATFLQLQKIGTIPVTLHSCHKNFRLQYSVLQNSRTRGKPQIRKKYMKYEFFPLVVIHFDNQPSHSVIKTILNVVFNQFVHDNRKQQSGLIFAIYIPPPKLLPVYFWSYKKESGRYWKMVLVLHFLIHPCVVLTARLILTSSPVVSRIITIPRQAGSGNLVLQQPDGSLWETMFKCLAHIAWFGLNSFEKI